PDSCHLLLGPYGPPRCRLGRKLFCDIRGWVPIRPISAGRISWPMTLVSRAQPFIFTGDLVNAVWRESALAVCHWWGVTPQTVSTGRMALGGGPIAEGTSRLRGVLARQILGAPRSGGAGARLNTLEVNTKKVSTEGKADGPRRLGGVALGN